MECVRAADLMVPIDQFATVNEESSLYDSVIALQKSRNVFGKHEKINAILVFDQKNDIMGKINFWDLLKAVEPRYTALNYPREITDRECCSECEFVSSVQRTYGLWREALLDLCSKAPLVTARDVMKPLSDAERIEESASMEEALNRMILRRLDSIVVMRGSEVVGVLRLSDIAEEILGRIEACPVSESSESSSEVAA